MSGINTPGVRLEQLKKVRDGLKKEFPRGTEIIVVKGEELPASEVIERMNECVRIYQAPEDARSALTTTSAARDEAEPRILEFLDAVHDGVIPHFGRSSQKLKAFGFPPKKKPKKMTAKQRVTRAEKAAVTRKAHGTLGKRQKKALKAGNPAPPPPPEGGHTG